MKTNRRIFSTSLSSFPFVKGLLFFASLITFTASVTAQIQQAWVAHYNNAITNGYHQALKLLGYGAVGNAIACDNNGNVYVAGYENVPGGGTQMVLIKYAPVTIGPANGGGSLLLPPGTFLLQAEGSANEPFEIQATTNFQSWLDLGTDYANTNGLMLYFDTNAAHNPCRFYLAIPQ